MTAGISAKFIGAMTCAPATPGISASPCSTSMQIWRPSRRGSAAFSRRATCASGMIVPKSFSRIQRAEQVALQREPVPVAARHLEDGLDAALHEEVRRRQAREMHLGARAIGDVDRGGQALERHRPPQKFGRIGGNRWCNFGGNDEL